MNIIVFSTHNFDRSYLENASKGMHDLTFVCDCLDASNAYLAEGYEGVAVFGTDHVDRHVIQQLASGGTKYIGSRSVGFDHIDLAAAKEEDIRVANVPAYSPYAIAEHAVGMLQAQNRKLLLSQKLMDQQDFRLDRLVGFDLHGKTIGVVGLGEIGSAFANIMLGFGCKLVAYDVWTNQEMVEKGVEYVTLNVLMQQSDVVYLSCPLNKQTHHMIAKKELALMKSQATLINTARGAVIDTSALIDHLDEGHLKGVCLDVYEYEKGMYFKDWRDRTIKDKLYLKLRSYERVLMTTHQGFLTETALSQIAQTTMKNFYQWESRGVADNEL